MTKPKRTLMHGPFLGMEPYKFRAHFSCRECRGEWHWEHGRVPRMDMLEMRVEEEWTIWLKCEEHQDDGTPKEVP